jgi:pimeloyl-ACP methyl ester carboxylesterase
LILVGEKDPGTPVEAAREIFDGLRPEIRRLEVIEGAGHFIWRDAAKTYWPIVERIRAASRGRARGRCLKF